MVKIYNSYTKKVEAKFNNYDEAIQWVGSKAQQMNYGICRVWEVDGFRYWDCGPVTYKIKVKDIPAERR